MVGTFVIDFFSSIAEWFVSLFPAYTGLPSSFTSGLSWAYGRVHSFDCLLPVSSIFTITVLFLAVATPLLSVRFFLMLAKRNKGGT